MKLAAMFLAAAAALSVSVATAATIVSITFTEEGTVLEAEGTLGGLDPTFSHQITMSAVGLAQVGCVLPNGRVTVGKPGFVSVGSRSQHLAPGETEFELYTEYELHPPTPDQANCPPQTRSTTILSVDWRGVEVYVFDRNFNLVLQQGFAL